MPLPNNFTIPAPNIPAPSTNHLVTATVEKPTLSNKELALYVGVPVVTLCVAGGLYYYYSKSSDDGKNTDDGAPVAVVAPLAKEDAERDTQVKNSTVF